MSGGKGRKGEEEGVGGSFLGGGFLIGFLVRR